MLRRHIACSSGVHDLGRNIRVASGRLGGAFGHGPAHILLQVLLILVTVGCQICVCGRGRGCRIFGGFLVLCSFSVPLSGMAFRDKVSGDLDLRAGFRGCRFLDFRCSLKLLFFFSPEGGGD